MREAPRNLCIVGAGRMGLALAMLVRGATDATRVELIGRRPEPPAEPLLDDGDGRVRYGTRPCAPDEVDAVLLCVPDAAIAGAAERVPGWGISHATPVLHTCGAVGTAPLDSLAGRGHPVGAVHPLAAIADPARDWTHLQGALYGVEGDADALMVAEWLAGVAGGRVVPVPAEARPAYHAAAVLASNDVVALLARAATVMAEAGLPAGVAEAGLAHLAAGAVRSVERSGAVAALTGPVARGDVETVRLHLARLSPTARRVYSCLGAEAVALARKGGLDGGVAAEIADLFEEAG